MWRRSSNLQGVELGPLHGNLERFGVAVGGGLAVPGEDGFRFCIPVTLP
jgi:hypothetical protein